MIPRRFLLLPLLLILLLLPANAAPLSSEDSLTVFFFHDTHDHWLPVALSDGAGTYGGYSRLATLLRQERSKLDHPSITLDGGDFSMGSLFQSLYASHAPQLQVLGAMGVDVTTFGNHEYDYRTEGWREMLNQAVDSGATLPAITMANYLPPEEDTASWEAWERYGVQQYILLERGGLRIAVFGLMGEDAHESAPMSGMVFHDPVKTAREMVALLRETEHPDFIICLSHSGTEDGKGEDYKLARAVEGIDLIISAHTHTTLSQPIQVGQTRIVSSGSYTRYLGKITLSRQGELVDYRLIPVDDTVLDDPSISAMTKMWKDTVSQHFLSRYGLEFDTVLHNIPFRFEPQQDVYTRHDSHLASLITDAYRRMAEQVTGQPVDVAATASGVIRDSLPMGSVTVADVFNMASLGIGADGLAGYPLISVYLTGEDLKTVLEIDASVAPIMESAHLYFSGVSYQYNTNRMIFNRVTDSHLVDEAGRERDIVDDQLYHVVTGLYCGQMLGTVEATSLGLLSVVPRDQEGNPIDMNRLDEYILHDSQGNEVKEWYAIVDYLRHLGPDLANYQQADGRKVVLSSWNPVELFRSPNRFTLIAVGGTLILLAVLTGLLMALRRRMAKDRRTRRLRRHRPQANARGYRTYRGR